MAKPRVRLQYNSNMQTSSAERVNANAAPNSSTASEIRNEGRRANLRSPNVSAESRRERKKKVKRGRRRQKLGKAYSPKTIKGLKKIAGKVAGPAALLYTAYEVGRDVTGTDEKSRAQILRNYLEEEGTRNVYTSKNPLREGDELARELEFLTNLSLAKQSAGRYSETRMAPGMSQITVDDLLSSGAFG